jgi:hypothetical protein
MMQVITVITDPSNHFFKVLSLSCAVNNLELIVLVAREAKFNNRVKDGLLQDYLIDIDDNEIILFTDGTDACFMAMEEEILTKFEKFNSDLVFSTEYNCWPDESLARFYRIEKETLNNYLNCGGFIGKAGLIKQLLEDNDYDTANYSWSNQYSWTKRYFKNTDKIKLDYYNEIFCSIGSAAGEQEFFAYNPCEAYKLKNEWFANNFIIKGNRLYNKNTQNNPCHLHFNGAAKHLLFSHIKQLFHSAEPIRNKEEFYYEL